MHPEVQALQPGQIYVSARSKSGRRWKIAPSTFEERCTRGYYLLPQGLDVSYSGGGGVRAIYVAGQVLLDPKRWTNVTPKNMTTTENN